MHIACTSTLTLASRSMQPCATPSTAHPPSNPPAASHSPLAALSQPQPAHRPLLSPLQRLLLPASPVHPPLPRRSATLAAPAPPLAPPRPPALLRRSRRSRRLRCCTWKSTEYVRLRVCSAVRSAGSVSKKAEGRMVGMRCAHLTVSLLRLAQVARPRTEAGASLGRARSKAPRSLCLP